MMSSNWNSIEIENYRAAFIVTSKGVTKLSFVWKVIDIQESYAFYARCKLSKMFISTFTNFEKNICVYDFNVKAGFKILFYFSFIAYKRLNNYHYNNFTKRLFNFMFLDIVLYVIYYTHVEIFMFLKNILF